MKLIIFLLSCVLIFKGAQCIKFNGINVPQMVVLDDHDDDGDVDDDDIETVILDCDYKVEAMDVGSFVVKWFKDNQVMHQWIRGKQPTVFPAFRDSIDESYEASEDPDYKYKAIRLENLSIDDSGMYKCLIQTFRETYQMEKFMQIIDVSNKSIILNTLKRDNETHLECSIENVYPEPKVIVTTEDDDEIPLVANNVRKKENGYYSGTTIAILDNAKEDDDESFKCIVEFGELPFNLTESSSNSSPDLIKGSWKPLLLVILIALMKLF